MFSLVAAISLRPRALSVHYRLPGTWKMAASTALIEVERKFEASIGADALEAAVAAMGGCTLGSVRFTDSYYDTPDCVLTRSDTWLRRRDSSWELKVPVEDDARRSGGERTVFREVEGAAEVAVALSQLQPDRFEEQAPVEAVDNATGEDGAADARLVQLIGAARMAPFAEFETVRSKHSLGRCTIDLDVASFGMSLIEIEVMCERADQVADAEVEIERVAALLQARPLAKGTGGKLETYIRRHCPEVLAQLVDAGILVATPP
eukprot:6435162-Prymnesium_polylepis.1